jgi:hypothetical protein
MFAIDYGSVLPLLLAILLLAAVVLGSLWWRSKAAKEIVVVEWEDSVIAPAASQNQTGRASANAQFANPAMPNPAQLPQRLRQAGTSALAHGAHLAPDHVLDAIDYEVVPLPAQATLMAQLDEIEVLDVDPNSVVGLIVQEQTPAALQAQFWNALGKPALAIEILEAVRDSDIAAANWLLLLDLYAQCGKQNDYETLRRRFKAMFNAQVPAWGERIFGIRCRRLCDVPELAQRVNRALAEHGVHGVLSYLRGLLHDNRNGTRQGFEYGVFCDLVRLYEAVSEGRAIDCCEALPELGVLPA